MERTHFKTILLIVGSGIGGILLFIAVLVGLAYFTFTSSSSIRFPSSESRSGETVSSAPEITEDDRFHGAHSRYTNGFSHDRSKTLDGGSAQFYGVVTVNKKPAPGIRLRLVLNGTVMSQWGKSDAEGKYLISVPPGKYRIDGYELDYSTANQALKGKTDNPQNIYDTAVIALDEKKVGRGPDLDFVDPVRKVGPFGEVSTAKPVVIEWKAYPGAATYEVQLFEQDDPRNFSGQKNVFDWNRKPVVSETSLDLQKHGVSLKKGFHYTVHVCALDGEKRRLSESTRSLRRADFLVTD
ncbi:MAG: hypothetical protein ACXW50_24310 [Candidatus Binatia bacterium]